MKDDRSHKGDPSTFTQATQTAPPLLQPDSKSSIPPTSSLTTNEDWLDSEAAAAYLGISPGTLRNLTSNGRVPFYKFGRRNRYLKSELRALILKNRIGGLYD